MSAPWTETQKADIRAYLGFPSLFHQQEPRLENAIVSVMAVSDGGVLPSSATQDRMILVLAQLNNIDCLLSNTQTYAEANSVDGDVIQVDYVRANFMLKMEGRRLISQLAIPLGTRPFRDYYSGLPLNDGFGYSSPFPTDLG